MGKNKLWKALITLKILSFLGGYVKEIEGFEQAGSWAESKGEAQQ